MYEIIGDPKSLEKDASDSPPCLVLEWMDCTLAQVPSGLHLQSYVLIKAILDQVLFSIDVLSKEDLVNTGIAPTFQDSAFTDQRRHQTRQHTTFRHRYKPSCHQSRRLGAP